MIDFYFIKEIRGNLSIVWLILIVRTDWGVIWFLDELGFDVRDWGVTFVGRIEIISGVVYIEF